MMFRLDTAKSMYHAVLDWYFSFPAGTNGLNDTDTKKATSRAALNMLVAKIIIWNFLNLLF